MTDSTIAVIGGGPAGAITAGLLARRGYPVSLFHRRRKRSYKAGETLPPVANGLLERLGITPLLQNGPHLPCPGNQSAFGSERLFDTDFIFSPHGRGWHLDRPFFEQQLLSLAREAGVRVSGNSRLRRSEFDSTTSRWLLTFSTGAMQSRLKAAYVIDASGIARAFMNQQNIGSRQDDKLAARIALFKTDAAQPDHRTMVEATENGWWYSSSIPGNQRVVMLFSDTDSKTFRDCNAVAGFLSLLQQTRYISPKLQQQCSGISWTSPVRVFTEPASSSRAHQVQGRRWLAVGDAAMSFDPLSSQGLWVGLQSAEIAANSAAGELENTAINGNIYSNWSEHVYRQYQQEKKNYYAMEARWRSQTFWQRRCS